MPFSISNHSAAR